ncbi:MAG: extracellular solute-binding protein [Oscillospiraceae bacterium]|nr:extracellular solute-binding protein [Oscillospiraceae bacterium]
MKNTFFKRAVSAALAAAVAVSFSACGGKKEKEETFASKDNVYSVEEIELPVQLTDVRTVLSDGNVVYIYGDNYESEEREDEYFWQSESKLVIMDLAGNLISETITYSDGSDNYKEKDDSDDDDDEAESNEEVIERRTINEAILDTNGSFWTREELIKPDESGGEFRGYMESDISTFFVKYDSSGEKVSEVNVDKAVEDAEIEIRYASRFTIDANGNFYINGDNCIIVVDSDGNFLFKLEGEASTPISGSWISGAYLTDDGRVVAIESKWRRDKNDYISTTVISEIDVAVKGYGKTYETSRSMGEVSSGSFGHDLVLNLGTSMRGYNLATDTATVIIDWVASGFDSTTLRNPLILPDGRILCVTRNYTAQGGGYSWSSNDGMTLSILTKVDPKDVPDKRVIKIASWYLDWDVRRAAVEFNKNSLEYQIEIISYTEDYGWRDANTKLNNDLIAGNIPDILMLSTEMPINSYISKGLLADLYTFIDNDPEINRSDLLECVLDAYSVNGKLYSIAPNFYVRSLAGKTSDVGENAGWTMDEFLKFAEANSDKKIFGEMTKEQFLQSALYNSMGSYVNNETGACSFDSEDFIKLLEFANTFPAEIDSSGGGYEYYRMGDDGVNPLLVDSYIHNFTAIREYEYGLFLEMPEGIGAQDNDPILADDDDDEANESAVQTADSEGDDNGGNDEDVEVVVGAMSASEMDTFTPEKGTPVTFIGFPSAQGNGSVLSGNTEFAIMEKASNPDGAWKFLQYFFTEEYQDKVDGAFPIRLSSLEKKQETAKQMPFWTDNDGNKVEYEPTYWRRDSGNDNGVVINIGVNTDEDNAKIMDLINSANQIIRYDQGLSNIIIEETDFFFAGQKSARDVAEIIQNRASLYISEGR